MNARRLMLLELILRMRKIQLSTLMLDEDLEGVDDLEGFVEHVRKITLTRKRLLRMRGECATRIQ